MIDAPFITCPDCENRDPFCETCNGTGRVYFAKERTVLDWWRDLSPKRRGQFIFAGAFVGALAFCIFVMWIAGMLW
jgi:hypothetical protein